MLYRRFKRTACLIVIAWMIASASASLLAPATVYGGLGDHPMVDTPQRIETEREATESTTAHLDTENQPIHTVPFALSGVGSPEAVVSAVEQETEPEEWWTSDDVALLAAVISAESRGESYEGQLAVGCVILNRMDDGTWGDTLEAVLYAKNQFAEPYWEYGESEEAAAIACLQGERVLPAGVVFFQRKKVSVWYGASWYKKIGCHNFYRKE